MSQKVSDPLLAEPGALTDAYREALNRIKSSGEPADMDVKDSLPSVELPDMPDITPIFTSQGSAVSNNTDAEPPKTAEAGATLPETTDAVSGDTPLAGPLPETGQPTSVATDPVEEGKNSKKGWKLSHYSAFSSVKVGGNGRKQEAPPVSTLPPQSGNEGQKLKTVGPVRSIPSNPDRKMETPLSVESFDKAYDRHRRSIHEKMENSRRQAMSLNSPNAQAKRAAPPPPPKNETLSPAEDELPLFFRKDEEEFAPTVQPASQPEKAPSASPSVDTTERYVSPGVLGNHSVLEEAVLDRIARENHSTDSSTLVGRWHAFAERRDPIQGGDGMSQSTDEHRLGRFFDKNTRTARKELGLLLPCALLLTVLALGGEGLFPFFAFLKFQTSYFQAVSVSLAVWFIAILGSRCVLTRGRKALLKLRINMDSMVWLSCIVSLLYTLISYLYEPFRQAAPPLVLSLWMLTWRTFARFWENEPRSATMKALSDLPEADTILFTSKGGYRENPTYMRVTAENRNNFYRSLHAEPAGEGFILLFLKAALVLTFIFTLLSAIFPPEEAGALHFLRCLTYFIVGMPTFGMLVSTTLLYRSIAHRLASQGAYPAGTRSFTRISRTGFTICTDRDLYPDEGVSISEPNLKNGFSHNDVFMYAASILSKVGCSLEAPFVRSNNDPYFRMGRVENLFYNGEAISADVEGHHVILGSVAAVRRMNLPTKLGTVGNNTPFFVVVDDLLAAEFIVHYNLTASSADTEHALRLLIRNMDLPIIATRDFNLTVDRVERDYRVKEGMLLYPPVAERVALSARDLKADPEAVILKRGNFRAMAESLEASRRFAKAAHIINTFTPISGAVNFLLMALFLSKGWFGLLSASTLIYFALLWALPIGMITLWAANILKVPSRWQK